MKSSEWMAAFRAGQAVEVALAEGRKLERREIVEMLKGLREQTSPFSGGSREAFTRAIRFILDGEHVKWARSLHARAKRRAAKKRTKASKKAS